MNIEERCHICGGEPSCVGVYEGDRPALACDECCGHGNEDGWCVPLDISRFGEGDLAIVRALLDRGGERELDASFIAWLLVDGRGNVLVERCPRKRALFGGEWFVPGGRINDGETPTAALWREMREEHGITPDHPRPLPLVDLRAPGRKEPFLGQPYVVESWRGEVPDHCLDHPEVSIRWMPIAEAMRTPVPAVRAMLAMIGTPPTTPPEGSETLREAFEAGCRYRADLNVSYRATKYDLDVAFAGWLATRATDPEPSDYPESHYDGDRDIVETQDRGAGLSAFSSDTLLWELVRRGRIHESWLLEDHIVHVGEDGWTMNHPLSCDLADCRFHRAAIMWGGPPREPGTYRFVPAESSIGYPFKLIPIEEDRDAG